MQDEKFPVVLLQLARNMSGHVQVDIGEILSNATQLISLGQNLRSVDYSSLERRMNRLIRNGQKFPDIR